MTVLIVEAEREANSTVGTIRRKIINRVKDTIMMLYKCIGHILEYYIQALSGSHYHKPDMDKLKKVRIKARCFNWIFVRHPPRHLGLVRGALLWTPKKMSYEDTCRLKRCGLTTLDRRRSR